MILQPSVAREVLLSPYTHYLTLSLIAGVRGLLPERLGSVPLSSRSGGNNRRATAITVPMD